MSQDHGSQMLT